MVVVFEKINLSDCKLDYSFTAGMSDSIESAIDSAKKTESKKCSGVEKNSKK